MAADDSTYKPGDPPPGGYLNWHAWAEVQDKAGLRQKKCRQCGLWKFPQELSGLTCLGCSARGVAPSHGSSPTERVVSLNLLARAREHVPFMGETWKALTEAMTTIDVPEVAPVHDAVWEALQRLIENAASLGPSSQEDAMVVARWRGQFVAARERAPAPEQVAVMEQVTPSRTDWKWLKPYQPVPVGTKLYAVLPDGVAPCDDNLRSDIDHVIEVLRKWPMESYLLARFVAHRDRLAAGVRVDEGRLNG